MYRQERLDAIREASGSLQFPSCPYCNGTRNAEVKHTHPATKPASRWSFWHHIVQSKFAALQTPEGTRNLRREVGRDDSGGSSGSAAGKQFVVGPMVDMSELPFRQLCRRHGATLTYTPMLHAKSFQESSTYRQQFLTVSPLSKVVRGMAGGPSPSAPGAAAPVDRPMFVQFCASDADTLLAAARFAVCGEPGEEPTLDHRGDRLYHCDAVDVNLGCPQGIAKRGGYGSFLMEQWDVIHQLIHTLHVELEVPVTVKMRIFDSRDGKLDLPLTIKYAEMIRDAGASVLCIHGRTRAMKGQLSGLADMAFVRDVCEALQHTIPVISNGNTLCFSDVIQHIELTGAQGHMCAEPLLWNPAVFSSGALNVPSRRLRGVQASKAERVAALHLAQEYLAMVQHSPVSLGFAKAHLFKLCAHSFILHTAERDMMGALPVSATPPRRQDAPSEAFQSELEALCRFVHSLTQKEQELTVAEEEHLWMAIREEAKAHEESKKENSRNDWFNMDENMEAESGGEGGDDATCLVDELFG